jgi:hypothetical protein
MKIKSIKFVRHGTSTVDACSIFAVHENGYEEPIVHQERHSPTGMNFGYHGSGCADAALSILWRICGPDVAEKYYMDFKNSFVAKINQGKGGEILVEDIDKWINKGI